MPLFNIHAEDELIWRYNNNGSYNIKSFYHAIMNNIIDNDHLKVPGPWMTIWKLKKSPKRIRK